MENFYFSPEKSGLSIVASVDLADSYEFDTWVVWKDTKKHFYWAHDSGCSCPTPFEDYDTIESLHELALHNFNILEKDIRGTDRLLDREQRDKIDDFLRIIRIALLEE